MMLVSNYHTSTFHVIQHTCKGVVMFSQSTYEINEGDGLLQAVLVLSVSLASDTVLQVETSSITATGTYII